MNYITLDSFLGSDYTNWLFDKITLPTDDSAEYVNILYSSHSGEKWISPLCIKLNGSELQATDQTKEILARLIEVKYKENWNRLYNALFADYNPIENYSVNEQETMVGNKTNNETVSIDETTTNTGTRTDAGTTSNTGTTKTNNTNDKTSTNAGTSNQTGTVLDKVYAEDSEEAVNSAGRDTTQTGTTSNNTTDKETQKGDITDTSTGTTSNTRTDDLSQKVAGTNTKANNEDTNDTRTLKKAGNIGVTTSQQMIESEIALRKHNFYDILFKDIDEMLCLSIY